MVTQTALDNFNFLLNIYCPNLFQIITRSEFDEFIHKSFQFGLINDGQEINQNFLTSIMKLKDMHKKQVNLQHKYEFDHLNILLGQAIQNNLGKKFKNLLKGSLLNFKNQSILDIMGEISCCVYLSHKFNFEQYEHSIGNNKTIDFKFSKNGRDILVEVSNTKPDLNKYEKSRFKDFLIRRVVKKYEEKTKDLNNLEKDNIYIFPVLHGLRPFIIREQRDVLRNFSQSVKSEYNINSFNQYSFCQYENGVFDFLESHKIKFP